MFIIATTWADVTVQSFQIMWSGFIGYLPSLLGAIIVFLIGWAIAVGLERLVSQIVKVLRIDPLLERVGLGKGLEKAGFKLHVGRWLGLLVKWFLIIVFLMASTEILGLRDVTTFLQAVLYYIPNVIVAVLIILVAVWAANVLEKIIRASASATNIKATSFAAAITKWAIWIFGFFAALEQLRIASNLLFTLETGIIAMLAIAGGLAFGLGGKDAATAFINKVRNEMKE